MLFNTTVAFLTLALSSRQPKWGYPGNPKCDLCKDGKRPGNPFGAAAILVPGEDVSSIYKCNELYFMGRQGKITDQMCKVTQYYMANICECREFKKDKPTFFWTVKNP